MRHEIKFVGSGGQGIITAAIVLAEAAANCGLNATQTQAYGPEARGKPLQLRDDHQQRRDIALPKIEHPDILDCSRREACDIYSAVAGSKCTILTDSSLSVTGAARVISLPIFSAAEKNLR